MLKSFCPKIPKLCYHLIFSISTSFKASHIFLTRVEIVVMAVVRISQGVVHHLILYWPPATLSNLPSLRHSYPHLISPFIHVHSSLDSLEICFFLLSSSSRHYLNPELFVLLSCSLSHPVSFHVHISIKT